ncbi:MAG: rRNA maturation RNase YbeY [Chitinophagales bacterium]|nr:rRNA maturation RNase YbeY [Chitinophagales bacterium]
MPIQFHYADVPKFNWKINPLKQWLKSIALEEGFKIEDLSYIFCSDEYLLNINIEYLQHNTYTDIITFDLSTSPQSPEIEAEIYISIDRVKENAQTLHQSFESEISRVLAHGILHLCGYKDKTDEEEILMRSKEDFYIKTSPLV